MSRRRSPRARVTQLAFDALTIEGGLLSPVWLANLAQRGASMQSEADYRVLPGLNLRDEIGRYWRVAQALWREFDQGRARNAEPHSVASRFVFGLLHDVFGFTSLRPADAPLVREGRAFPVTHFALGTRVPVVVAAAAEGLDTPSPVFGEGGRRRSAFGLAQEFLNATDEALWGLCCDGITLRLLRDNASLTRPAWIEADLARIFTEDRYADFAALWLLLHESRFGSPDKPPSDCALEAWRAAGREEGTRARDKLRAGVEAALLAFGQGFVAHPDNGALRDALRLGQLSPEGLYQQLLRLVYRLIFLLTAEERGVLHAPDSDKAAQERYAQGYSLGRLRERSVRRSAHDRHHDLWEALRIVFVGVGAGQPRLALPALGGLFATEQCPHLDAARLSNSALLTGVFKLSWLHDEGAGLSRVNWRDMGPEELGSVYESLLELVPQVELDTRRFAFATGDETRGNARKTSGSYYTPDSLVQVLLDSALEPVVADTLAAQPADPVEALLSLSVVDPACGSGHFLLAAARRLAAHVARLSAKGSPSAAEYRHALRQVVSRCIYGVDLNPMALELCRVSLWMEAVEPGRPLSFLDAHLQHGNALLGATPALLAGGIPDAAWEPIEGDDKKIASALKKRNKQGRSNQPDMEKLWSAQQAGHDEVARAVERLDRDAEDDLGAVQRKASTWGAIQKSSAYEHERFVADAWCAAFVWPKSAAGESTDKALKANPLVEAAPVHAVWDGVRRGVSTASGPMRETVRALAAQYHFFHWHLAFPQVFKRGGFDVVLGNPPWDTLSPDAKEFFSRFDPQVRFQTKEEQETTYAHLCESPSIAAEWARHRRMLFATAFFIKESGRFTLFAPGNLGKGDFNIYRMFVELALTNIREGGYAAQVVPDGLYAGANCMAIRKALFERYTLDALLGFENSKGVWFPDVDTRAKFTLYAARRGGSTTILNVAFGLCSPEALQLARAGSTLKIPVTTVEEFSPDALAIMEFRSQTDIDIATKMYARWPKFGDIQPNTPQRVYMAEIHMGNDRDLFDEDPSGIPVYEGRMVAQYDHRAKVYAAGRGRSAEWVEIPFGDPRKAIGAQWYVPRSRLPKKVLERVGIFRVGFCDVASPTNERTLVATIVPPNTVCGHKVPTMVYAGADFISSLIWVACANSFTLDFLSRQKVALSMSYTVLDSLPIPRLGLDNVWTPELTRRALLLLCTGPEMIPLWNRVADAHGWVPRVQERASPPGEVVDGARRVLVAEIEAIVAKELFGLTKQELAYVMDTFPIVRKHDEKEHGEFRTKRLVLEAYDALAEAARSGRAYVSRLTPPPADPQVAHPARDGAV